MNEPENWRWFWLAITVLLAVGEMATPGTFFMISFAIGAAVACVLAFLDVNVAVQWLAFVAVSGVALLALLPLGRRLNRGGQQPVGATRFAGARAVVIRDIPGSAHGTGTVRLEREEWRAESADGTPIAEGSTVEVLRVDGTRLIVGPLEDPA